MRKLLYLLPVCCLLIFTACDDDTSGLPEPDVTDVTLNFKAMYGGQEVDFNTTAYDYNGSELTISKYDFYISQVSLFKNVESEKEKVELVEIDFINITDNNNSVTIQVDDILVGEYDGIAFSIGVPSDLNSQIPGDFSSTHPLGLTNLSHYWSGWGSYIFSKYEGKINPGTDDEVSFSYHIGSDQFFTGPVYKNLGMTLELGQTENIDFEIDLQSMLMDIEPLDIPAFPNSHSLDNITAATHIHANISNSITVQ